MIKIYKSIEEDDDNRKKSRIHLNNAESKNVESKNVEIKMSKTKMSKIKIVEW